MGFKADTERENFIMQNPFCGLFDTSLARCVESFAYCSLLHQFIPFLLPLDALLILILLRLLLAAP
jgi:hypothetical protein